MICRQNMRKCSIFDKTYTDFVVSFSDDSQSMRTSDDARNKVWVLGTPYQMGPKCGGGKAFRIGGENKLFSHRLTVWIKTQKFCWVGTIGLGKIALITTMPYRRWRAGMDKFPDARILAGLD